MKKVIPIKDLTIAVFQMRIISADKEKNLEKLKQALESLKHPVDLLVVPELFTTGFMYSQFKELVEEENNSDSLQFLEQLAEEHSTGLAGTILLGEQKTKAYLNVGFIISPGKGVEYSYRKINLWSSEKKHFKAGTELTKPIDFEGKAKIGMQICYDLRFPEMCRNLVIAGAEICITPAAWPRARVGHFELLASSRALENTCYHITTNRVGSEIEPQLIAYSGSSRVIDPLGNVLAGAGNFEQVITTTLSGSLLSKAREKIPVLKDRKIAFME